MPCKPDNPVLTFCKPFHKTNVSYFADAAYQSPTEKKITDREYRAKYSGQKKLDERNSQILADGLIPRKTVFQTQKEFLRTAIKEAAASSCNLEKFQRLLMEKYSIKLKTSQGRFSYLHPERSKCITERMLGTHYGTDYLLKLFEETTVKKENKKN